jgi:hypothetical protein
VIVHPRKRRTTLSSALIRKHSWRSTHAGRRHTWRRKLHATGRRASRASWWRESRRKALWKSWHTYETCQNLSDYIESLGIVPTRWEVGHARRWCETWWQTLWERRHSCGESVFKSGTHIFIRVNIPAGNPGGIPPGGIGNPGGRPAGGTMPPGGPKPGGAVFSIGLFADCPSAAYEFVMLSMTLCAFSCPICW